MVRYILHAQFKYMYVFLSSSLMLASVACLLISFSLRSRSFECVCVSVYVRSLITEVVLMCAGGVSNH